MSKQTQAVERKLCTECGAENWPYADACWLCKGDLSKAELLITAELVKHPVHSAAEPFFAIVCGLLAIVMVLVGIGLAIEEPGGAVGYLILVLPPFIITLIRTTLKQQRTGKMSWGERLATFIVSTVAFAGILFMLVIAALVAFFVFCLVALAGGGF